MTTPDSHLYARHLARVVESSDDAIVSKSLDGTIMSWNRAAERMFGYPASEAVGRNIRMIIPAELLGEEDDVIAQIRSGRMVDHYETVRQRKDGSRLHISLTVSPIKDDNGEIIGASKVARDITERVRLFEMTRAHAQIAQKLHEVGTVLASNLDRDAVVQKVTDIATELTGAEFGAFFYNVTDPQSRESYMLYTLSGASKESFENFPQPRATEIFAQTFHGHGTLRLDDVTRDARYGHNAPYFGMPDGHLPVRSYLAVPVLGRNARVLGGLFFGHSKPGVFTEIHEQLAEGVAGWATVSLENARLYVEARMANRLKDEVLAVLSHELRTPLAAIVGYARLLRGGLLSEEKAQRGLEALDRNASLLTQIVEDLLDVSRIISGKLRLDVQPVDMPLVVHNAIATIQPTSDAKQVRLQTVIDPSVGPVAGDRDRLQQVVWNLLSNAVKFTPKHGRVQIRLERVNSHVELVVADTGVGIAPEFMPHVFERFTQGDGTTTRKTGGLGIGLAIVRHIVEMHGGTVEAASAGENQGATFRVRLPVMIVHPQQKPLQGQHPRTELLSPLGKLGDLGGVTVLAVDDDQDSLSLLRTVLETSGAQVVTLSSPDQAVARIAETKPDALLLDLGMPDLDGYELIRRIRASDDMSVRRVPAAALTAFARAEDRTRALQSGFEMHLAKPVDPGELVAAVATLVRRGR